VWAETFKYLADNGVIFEGILLKPSMVTPGAECKNRADPDTVSAGSLPSCPGPCLAFPSF
jgi:fructose-bisphosphate aldolase class I